MKIIKILKRALILSAPFLLITISIVCFSYFVFNNFILTNSYFSMIVNSNTITTDEENQYLVLDDYTREKLKENNEGMRIKSDFPAIALGEQWATITIEAAGVYDQPVTHGETLDVLDNSIGHSPNSRFPGQNGRIVIPGHVGISRFFQRLDSCKPGDLVELNTIYGDYVYKVVDTVIFKQTDYTWVLPLEEETADQLVCYTCYPYLSTGVRTKRFAIICEKVSGESWVDGEYEEGENQGE